jgi:long-chain acyl-CoA synthetase
MHLAQLPSVRSEQSPSAPALTDDRLGTLCNSAFAEHVELAAHTLSAAGVGEDTVVAVKLSNRVELVVTLFAAWRLGAAVTPINPALTLDEVTYQVRDSSAVVIVAESDDAIDDVAIVSVGSLMQASEAKNLDPVTYASDALALVVYTSGSTGRPKGVELTHGNLDAMTASMIESMALSEADHSLLILPLFHVNGIVVSILSPLLAGGQATIAGRFAPQTFFDYVEKAGPTYFSGVPAIYAMLSTLPPDVVPNTSSLRFAVCGAAPMPAQYIAAFENRYNVPLIEGYGLSESTCASTTNPLNGPRKPGTVGLPLPGQTVAIMDSDGNLVTDGKPGEVVISGPTVMRGYLNRPAETAETLRDGWLHTGDIGRLDEDGYLTLVDRVKDIIIRGGENIMPKEVENAIYGFPSVLEAAVVGRPHPVLGEVPVAFVSMREPSPTAADNLLTFLETKLAKFKLPAEITIIDEVPKNPVGKIDKPRLRRDLTPQSA